jgi:methionine synthase I (cobalamin-dependent)
VHQDDFAVMIDEILQLWQQFGLKIFGGCCGTNDQFLAALAAKLNQPPQPDELLDKS